LIEAGEVKISGKIVKDARFLVRPETAAIEVKGVRVEKGRLRVILLNKPRGLITTRSDEKGRKTIFSCVPASLGNLHAVGRLDAATSGLLLLTNSTRLSSWLTDPENAVPRLYRVSVRGEVSEETLAKLKLGVRDEGEWLKPSSVELHKASGRESHLMVELREGKNREIRRLFLAFGHEVSQLKRVQYGELKLGELASGKFRELAREEVLQAFPSAPI
jgi:23S rRNA pseudouridine2605 synthase